MLSSPADSLTVEEEIMATSCFTNERFFFLLNEEAIQEETPTVPISGKMIR
jgi:hypothetical protein